MARRLALRDLKAPERLAELAEHQQAKVRELEGRSETEVAIAIQQCFRHLSLSFTTIASAKRIGRPRT